MKAKAMETLVKKFNKDKSEVAAEVSVELLIYRTDISTKKREKLIQAYFDQHPQIVDWNVDRQDVDNVLRIAVTPELEEFEILSFIKDKGLHCQAL